MEKTLFLQLNKHNIYLLADNNISFYISVPKKEYYTSTNISIDLRDNFNKIDFSQNDDIYVKDQLNMIYGDIDYENITLIIPIFKNDILNLIKNEPSEKLFTYLDQCISYIINNAYKVLVDDGINVNSKIIFVKNEKFDNFISWFGERYKSRVDTKQYSELIGDFTSVIPVLNTDNIIDIPTDKNENNNEISVNVKENGGFVSYLLLGFLGAALTLFILYMLL